MTYTEIITQRRAFKIADTEKKYATLADVDFDGDWVTPYQISSRSPTGPVLVAKDWFDEPSVKKNKDKLKQLGYMPGILFNNVIDLALADAGLKRCDIYMTQAFHFLPKTERSARIPLKHFRLSFEAITQYELEGREVITLGGAADKMCLEFHIDHQAVPHPSARGQGKTIEYKAQCLTDALRKATGIGLR